MVTEISWHEVAHPQIHGHDINTISITKGEGNHHYISREVFFSELVTIEFNGENWTWNTFEPHKIFHHGIKIFFICCKYYYKQFMTHNYLSS